MEGSTSGSSSSAGFNPNYVQPHPNLSRQTSAVEDPTSSSTDEQTLRARRGNQQQQQQQMQDLRPSMSVADAPSTETGFMPPPRQASLTALAANMSISDDQSQSIPARGTSVGISNNNNSNNASSNPPDSFPVPMPRQDSLMAVTVDPSSQAKAAMAAKEAMGIEDFNRGTMTKDDSAGWYFWCSSSSGTGRSCLIVPGIGSV